MTTVPRRHLRGDGTGGGRWRNRRPSHYSNRILLDKFIKMTKYDCSLLGKAPFDLKVRGSYFDAENNVDRDKNRRVGQMVRNKDMTAEGKGFLCRNSIFTILESFLHGNLIYVLRTCIFCGTV